MSTPAAGRSLELYYIDGRPDGMLTAEMFNWTGHVLMVPRTQLAEALGRTEAGYAGVYLLVGDREGEPLAYVGESEDIGGRIKSHDVKKDWWSSAVLVTTAGNKLNKAHVRYLEARLIEEARKVGRTPLDNATAPTLPGLSEADVAKMEAFLENLLIVLPALRIDMFIQRSRPAVASAPSTDTRTAPDGNPRFTLSITKAGPTATAVLREGEFIVQAGSQARAQWTHAATAGSFAARIHRELTQSGALAADGQLARFTKNYSFTSPSAAASVVAGRPANGTGGWKTEDGKTYREWEAGRLAGGAA